MLKGRIFQILQNTWQVQNEWWLKVLTNIAKLKEILQKFLLCGKVTTKFAPKTKSYIHSTWNTNHHKNGKKEHFFSSKKVYTQAQKKKTQFKRA